MKKSIQMIVVLVVVGMASGLVLAGIYKYAQPKIETHREEEKEKAIYNVLEGVERIELIEHEEGEIYQGLDGEGKVIGYAFEAKGTGYQGEIVLMIGLSADLTKVLAIVVLESRETPGLGSKIEGEDFKNQFKNLDASRIAEVEAISGATISSKSVLKIIEQEIAKIKGILKQVNE